MELNNVDQVNDWDKWKKTLKTAVNVGESVGMSEESISKVGTKIGDFLSNNVDPENREQRILKELWDEADDQDKKTLTKMISRMVDK
ncbi:MAG: DUF3243 domain-containing protein [Eubacteriales bacterium]